MTDHFAERAAYTAGLRALADWLDANACAPLPDTNVVYKTVVNEVTLESVASICGLDLIAHGGDTLSAMRAFGPILYDAFTLLPGHPLTVPEPETEPF